MNDHSEPPKNVSEETSDDQNGWYDCPDDFFSDQEIYFQFCCPPDNVPLFDLVDNKHVDENLENHEVTIKVASELNCKNSSSFKNSNSNEKPKIKRSPKKNVPLTDEGSKFKDELLKTFPRINNRAPPKKLIIESHRESQKIFKINDFTRVEQRSINKYYNNHAHEKELILKGRKLQIQNLNLKLIYTNGANTSSI